MKEITLALLLVGRPEMQASILSQTLVALKRLPEKVQTIIAMDSPQWMAIPELQMFAITEDAVIISEENDTEIVPAHLMNVAQKKAEGKYLLFSLLEAGLEDKVNLYLDAISNHYSDGEKKSDELPVFYFSPDVTGSGEYEPPAGILFGWMQCTTVGLPLSSMCVPDELAQRVFPLDEVPLLYLETERYYMLGVTKYTEPVCIGKTDSRAKCISQLPLKLKKIPRHDLAVRYATYAQISSTEISNTEMTPVMFCRDLNPEEREEFCRYCSDVVVDSSQTAYDTHYRILIVGGIWEYHHNQICFFNYLEKLYGNGFATFRAIYEYNQPANIVLNYDLVIFTRCRTENALKMMRKCNQYGIPSMYMIDDNWLTIKKDHPQQGAIFTPGNPNYDNFIEALGLCKATWLFNDILREDVLPYTKCVQKFTISVNLDNFISEKKRERSDDQIYIGFSGSLRWNDTAFRALARYARRNKNVKVLLVGGLSEEQERLFKTLDPIRIPFCSYTKYSKIMAELSPDLLLAPLPDTRTSNSKCANKYIEAAAAGAVCLYSKCHPYIDVIEDGVNGFFVEEETDEVWYQRICEILDDLPALRRVQAAAVHHIETQYSVDSQLHAFAKKIDRIITTEDLKDD